MGGALRHRATRDPLSPLPRLGAALDDWLPPNARRIMQGAASDIPALKIIPNSKDCFDIPTGSVTA
jgi:hypothetical protein